MAGRSQRDAPLSWFVPHGAMEPDQWVDGAAWASSWRMARGVHAAGPSPARERRFYAPPCRANVAAAGTPRSRREIAVRRQSQRRRLMDAAAGAAVGIRRLGSLVR